MDSEKLSNILRILKLIGGKFIIVEDGHPQAVLMDYEEFEKLAVPWAAEQLAKKAVSHTDEVNKLVIQAQLQDLREEVLPEATPEIRIEPLD